MDMMRKTLGFLRSLRRHNDREWFNAHKEEYLQIKAYVDELAARLIAEVAKVDSRASGLTPIRKSKYDEIDEFRSIVEDEDFRKLFTNLGANPVKTAPQGIPRDWEFIEYVKPRDFLADAPLTDDFLLGGDLAEKLAPYIAQAKRFNDFINYTIEEYMGL